jgi:type III secretion protein Q
MDQATSKAPTLASDGAHPVARADMDRLSPPLVAPSHVHVLNAFYLRRQPLAIKIAGRKATIATAWPPANRHAGAYRYLTLTIDGEKGGLLLPRSLLDILIVGVDPQLSLDRLRPEYAGLVVEFALTETLHAIEANFGWTLAFVSIGPPLDAPGQDDRPTLSLALEIEGIGASTCDLCLPLSRALKVVRHLDRHAAIDQACIDLPVAACLRVAAATLTVEETRTLSPGDVVLVDAHCRPNGTALAVIAGHLVAPVELTPAGGRLVAAPTRGRGTQWEWSMEDNPHDASNSSAPEASDLDDLPVRLVFEVGRLELVLSEIRRLAPGALLPLARPLDDAVDIVANGRRIGRGTIVSIGDSVGVRVTRLVSND